jgi:hypothetical protein
MARGRLRTDLEENINIKKFWEELLFFDTALTA